ncbi:hypothetical protein CLU79DRAFT_890109 [Phycomyces nitens]|nr:hypothetical protein CLU79DRAFT_890109 [Phycomyces nitens]
MAQAGEYIKTRPFPFSFITPAITTPYPAMQLFSIQQRFFSKCQRRQARASAKPETKNTESKSKIRPSHCTQIFASVKKVLQRKNTKEPVPASLLSSSSSVSYESCASEPTEDDLTLRSYRLSAKTMVLDAIIFDHPSITVCIRPASYRST